MSYSKWRQANMSEIQKHTALDVLSGFKKSKFSGIDEKTGMSNRMAKRGLEWIKKVKDLKTQKDQIKITDVQALSEEACMMADDMFEETDVTKEKPTISREDSFLSRSSGITDESKETTSSDDDSELDDMMNDPQMKQLFSGINSLNSLVDDPTGKTPVSTNNTGNMENLFSGLGGMMGGLVTGVMGGLVGKKNPLIMVSLENVLQQLRDKLKTPENLTQEEVVQVNRAEKKMADLITAYDDPAHSSDDLTKMYIAATQEASKAGVTVDQSSLTQQTSQMNLDQMNMENQLENGCSVM